MHVNLSVCVSAFVIICHSRYTLFDFPLLLPNLIAALKFLVEPHQTRLWLLVLTDQDLTQVPGVELVKPQKEASEVKYTNYSDLK